MAFDNTEEDELHMGFDLEWDSLTNEDLNNQVPVVMQLAMDVPAPQLISVEQHPCQCLASCVCF